MSFRFEILHRSQISQARVGRIHTPHGVIDTPGFVAVGTNGTIKALDNRMVEEIGLQLMFCNTYHLLLQPGTDVIKNAGGLHSFMSRRLPIITDSGGFQVFSLAYGSVANELKGQGTKRHDSSVLKISEQGVCFRSYRDGSKVLLTPESSVQAQKDFGADIIIPFDELPPYHIEGEKLKASLERTHRWEKRSLDQHLLAPNNQAMYGVIHGGISLDLRAQSARHLSHLAFDGFAIGGSIGKNREEMRQVVQHVMPLLPLEKPVHLLGIGDLTSLKMCLPLGVDTFDSSYPTKAARHGVLLHSGGAIYITKRAYRHEQSPPDRDCTCYTCRHFSAAYLHHLFKARELTALSLATIHNLHFMVQQMALWRQSILQNIL